MKRKRCSIDSRVAFACCVGTFFVILVAEIVYVGRVLLLSSRPLRPTKLPMSFGDSPPNDSDGKGRILSILREAGVTDLSRDRIEQLPTWKQVVDLYGQKPVIHNLQSCARFRETVPEVERMLGSAGMFSSGTNLVTRLLKGNCYIPARLHKYGVNASKEDHGMRFQVPYGKHTPHHYRYLHSTEKAAAIRKENLLPVVTIRNPWTWMQSMCKNPYTAKWAHWQQCPNLRPHGTWNEVSVQYAAGTDEHKSLAHLYNDWYNGYFKDADYPFVMIRMEDLVFHTKETITQVCECAGGRIRNDRPFAYVTESAKNDSPGHDTSTGLIEAIIKYSQPLQEHAGFTLEDYQAALEAIDEDLTHRFQYQNPRVQ